MNHTLHHKVNTIFTIIRLAKNNNLQYVLEDESAKKLTKSLMEHMYNFSFVNDNYDEYIKSIDESLNIL